MKIKTLAAAISTIVLSSGACVYAENNNEQNNSLNNSVRSERGQQSADIKNNHMKNNRTPQSSNVTDNRSFQSYTDGKTVTMTGTVKKVDDDDFVLNHNGEEIKVELDGWSWNEPDLNKYLEQGQTVTVTGEVDDDWFEQKELEAKNIYLDTERVYFYTVDVNPAYAYITTSLNEDQNQAGSQNQNQNQNRMSSLEDGSYFNVRGEIKSIEGREIVLTSDSRTYRVDVSQLGYDPLDNEGLQKLAVGDRIYVSGEVDDNFFAKKEIDADLVVTINDASEDSVAAQ